VFDGVEQTGEVARRLGSRHRLHASMVSDYLIVCVDAYSHRLRRPRLVGMAQPSRSAGERTART
jgi:hypothetical protein